MLHEVMTKWKMKINREKTKAMVVKGEEVVVMCQRMGRLRK